ncbi:hypothetical protein HanIR_Chr07g0335341 [Helianthus annuus]|nr:hypothetical protein HanIR_Chr07g0335341 [Helianthus annuus]
MKLGNSFSHCLCIISLLFLIIYIGEYDRPPFHNKGFKFECYSLGHLSLSFAAFVKFICVCLCSVTVCEHAHFLNERTRT